MTPLRLGIDLDGVLANFTDAFADVLAKTSGRMLVTEYPYDPLVWDWPQHVGFTDAEVTAAWKRVHQSPDFWQSLLPKDGAVAFLDQLWRWVAYRNWGHGESHEVYFITNRDGLRAKDQTEQWLIRHGFGGKHPTVLIARGEKGPLVPALGLTHVVDDRPENLTSYLICGLPADRAVLYRANYNAPFADRHPHTVGSLAELATRWGITT